MNPESKDLIFKWNFLLYFQVFWFVWAASFAFTTHKQLLELQMCFTAIKEDIRMEQERWQNDTDLQSERAG